MRGVPSAVGSPPRGKDDDEGTEANERVSSEGKLVWFPQSALQAFNGFLCLWGLELLCGRPFDLSGRFGLRTRR